MTEKRGRRLAHWSVSNVRYHPLAMKLKITRIKIHKETQEKKINIKSKFKKKLTEIHKILKIFIFRRELHDKFL